MREREQNAPLNERAVRVLWDVGVTGTVWFVFAAASLAILLASGQSVDEYLVPACLGLVAFSLPWPPLEVGPEPPGAENWTFDSLGAAVRRALLSKWVLFLLVVLVMAVALPGVARVGGVLLGAALAASVEVAAVVKLERRSGACVVRSGEERRLWRRERVVLIPHRREGSA